MRFVHCQFELVHMCVVAVRRRQQVCEYIEIQVLFERYVSPYIYVDLLAQQIMINLNSKKLYRYLQKGPIVLFSLGIATFNSDLNCLLRWTDSFQCNQFKASELVECS